MPFVQGLVLGANVFRAIPSICLGKLSRTGMEARFIELAGHVNPQMPHFVISKIQSALNDQTKIHQTRMCSRDGCSI